MKKSSCIILKNVIHIPSRTDDREAEGARLEIVCTPKGYRGFESHSVRHLNLKDAL